MKKSKKYTLLLLLLVGGALCAHASWMPTKAWLAEKLIQRSWQHFQKTGETLKPWPWADTHAIASLQFARLKREVIVLDGGDPSTLAFSAGAVAPFNQAFNYLPFVVAGHRDSHFSFLSEVKMSDIISLTDKNGHIQLYQVDSIDVIDNQNQQLSVWPINLATQAAAKTKTAGETNTETKSKINTTTNAELILITCYPFNALSARGSLRYVIRAKPLP
jgi:sortase A